MSIRENAKGRWPEIITALLGAEYVTGKHGPCPMGEGKDRFRFTDLNGNGHFFCSCSGGEADGFELLMCVNGWDFRTAAEAVESIVGKEPMEEKPESWASKLRKEVVKTKRSAYLAQRGLEVPPILDWHKSLPYFVDGKESGRYPAMLAPVMRGGKFVTYHVTHLDGGKKADIDPCRKILPGGGISGAAVPLYPPVAGFLGVAEGIETAIAAKMLFDCPVHAALNTSGMEKWIPPEGVTNIIIYADNDENYAGHKAAYTLAHKLICKGYTVGIEMPEEHGDWNDVLLDREMAA